MKSRTSESSGSSALIERAIETFIGGFGFTRSFTHPYASERFGRVRVMRDGPRKNAKNYRTEEWIAHSVAPEEIDRIARKNTRGRFAVCAIVGADEPAELVRAGFKAIGYRLGTTEPFMVHDLRRIPTFDAPAAIERVLTQPLADQLAKAAGSRQILPEHFAPDAKMRQYVALIDGQCVGWVRSITVDHASAGKRKHAQSTWCSNMHVLPEFRRRGIARAMLARMLSDDREHGSSSAVLLASHTGALLYPIVGYQQIAMLFLYTPTNR